jgi:hypothetical protein
MLDELKPFCHIVRIRYVRGLSCGWEKCPKCNEHFFLCGHHKGVKFCVSKDDPGIELSEEWGSVEPYSPDSRPTIGGAGAGVGGTWC